MRTLSTNWTTSERIPAADPSFAPNHGNRRGYYEQFEVAFGNSWRVG